MTTIFRKAILIAGLVLACTFPLFSQAIQLPVGVAANISFGPMVDPSDGVTCVTTLVSALDHASTGIKLSKNGGALTIRHATVTASTYDSYCTYIVHLDTTDMNTIGNLVVQFADATVTVPWKQTYQVVGLRAFDRNVTGNITSDDEAWGRTGGDHTSRTLTGATNITSSGNAIPVASDDKVLLAATTHDGAQIPTLEALLPSALVGGKMDSHVADIAANAITAASLAADAGTELAGTLLDLPNGIETGFTLRAMQRLMGATLLGKISGVDTNSPVFRDVNDTKNRVSAVVSPAGRLSVTYDPN